MLTEQAALAGAAGRRGDAVGAQALAAAVADPVGGPGRGQPALQLRCGEAGLLQGVGDVLLDHLGGRAAGVGRGDHHMQVATLPVEAAHDAQIDHADDRDFRVHDCAEHGPGLFQVVGLEWAGAAVAGDQLTRSHRDRLAAGTAFRPAGCPGAHCAHHGVR
ncbi:hypothetical protein D3C80_1456640 [compost metagenome]